jgi:replicative DNA helicase
MLPHTAALEAFRASKELLHSGTVASATVTKAHTTSAPGAKAIFTYDKRFQLRMLATLYQDPEFACATGVHLSPDHFEKRSYRWLAAQILSYAETYGHGISDDALRIQLDKDLRTRRLPDKLKVELEALIDGLEEPIKDRSFIKDELRSFIKNQATKEAILRSLDHLERHDFDAIDREFTRVIEISAATEDGLGISYTRDIEFRTKARKEYIRNGIPCGLLLDDHLKPGGLPPKSLGIVVAPPGKGKSHALVHIGKNAILDGKRVLHITLELTAEYVADRYDASFTGIALNALEERADDVAERIEELGARFTDADKREVLVIKEFPTGTLTVKKLRSFIRTLERVGFYPDEVIVDYAGLMQPEFPTGDEYTDLGKACTELRAMAMELGIPIWTAAQGNRGSLGKEILTGKDLADSFKMLMIGDVLIAICQTEVEEKTSRGRIFVIKNRYGKDGWDFNITMDWSRSTIRSATT